MALGKTPSLDLENTPWAQGDTSPHTLESICYAQSHHSLLLALENTPSEATGNIPFMTMNCTVQGSIKYNIPKSRKYFHHEIWKIHPKSWKTFYSKSAGLWVGCWWILTTGSQWGRRAADWECLPISMGVGIPPLWLSSSYQHITESRFGRRCLRSSHTITGVSWLHHPAI